MQTVAVVIVILLYIAGGFWTMGYCQKKGWLGDCGGPGGALVFSLWPIILVPLIFVKSRQESRSQRS